MMFIYMPAVFGAQFTPYIGQIIVPILKVSIRSSLSFEKEMWNMLIGNYFATGIG